MKLSVKLRNYSHGKNVRDDRDLNGRKVAAVLGNYSGIHRLWVVPAHPRPVYRKHEPVEIPGIDQDQEFVAVHVSTHFRCPMLPILFADVENAAQNIRSGASWMLIAAGIAFYLLPTIIALLRSHPNGASILVVNLFLGWSCIGWIVALAWSVSAGNPGGQHIHHYPSRRRRRRDEDDEDDDD